MRKVKPYNFIHIAGWMLELGLSGNELIVYALIYGFSQDEQSKFEGSIAYIQEWIGASSKTTAINLTKKLEERGLVYKEQFVINNVTFNRYKALVPDNVHPVQSLKNGSTNSVQGVVQKMDNGGSTNFVPNNISSNSSPIMNNSPTIPTTNNTNDKPIDNNNSPQSPQGVCEEVSVEEQMFESFRRMYKGSKRGCATEFDNFRKKHKDWREVLPTLSILYQKQQEIKEKAKRNGAWIPQEKNLQTYINNRCWEEEVHYECSTKNTTERNGESDFIRQAREWASSDANPFRHMR